MGERHTSGPGLWATQQGSPRRGECALGDKPWSGNLATVNISLYIDGWVGRWMNDWVDDRWMDR